MKKTILITGGCGFIGHHFVEHIYVKTDWNIIVLDKLTYASYGLERLRDTGALESGRVKTFTYDLSHPLSVVFISSSSTSLCQLWLYVFLLGQFSSIFG